MANFKCARFTKELASCSRLVFLMHETAGTQKWEGRATEGGLRLDLQSINNGWANWTL
jgi:hypothetical protein